MCGKPGRALLPQCARVEAQRNPVIRGRANVQSADDSEARYGRRFSRIVIARIRDTALRGDPFAALGHRRPCSAPQQPNQSLNLTRI